MMCHQQHAATRHEGLPLVPPQHHEPTGTVPGTMSQLQAEFLERKSNEKISPPSLQQPQSRTAALIQAVGGGRR